jgi:phosphoribosyl 1,2-cyclic phosphodiesterase
MKTHQNAEWIKFLGTAGARVVVSKQLRASGGLWMALKAKNLIVDPGPGTLVNCFKSRPKLNPALLDAILISHRHIDHSNDANIMIEAMTQGGFMKKGLVFAPADALENEPVIFSHVKNFVQSIIKLQEKKTYKIGELEFETSPCHKHHQTETYGFKIYSNTAKICVITDTSLFPELLEFYRGDILIINTVRRFRKGSQNIEHLSADDVKDILSAIRPKTAIITHFGMTVIQAKPWKVAKEIQDATSIKTIAASDGMKIDLAQLL